MNIVQCYTPSGGPSCRTQGFCHSYPALVTCRQQGLYFCLINDVSVVPSGIRGLSPAHCRSQRLFFVFFGSLSLIWSFERCRLDKDLFFVLFGSNFVRVSRALSAQQGLFFWYLLSLVYSCVADSRVLLYGV